MLPLGVEQIMHIARQHADAGRAAEAEGLCRQVLKERPNSAEAFALLGLLAFRAGQFDRSIQFLNRAIAIDGTVAESHCNLGVALNATGDVQLAIAAHSRAIELQPDRAELHANLGAALASAERWEEAIAAYQKAIGINSNFADAHYNLGNALQAIERFEDAAAAYEDAVRCHPAFGEAYCNLGFVLRSQGRLDEAVASYDKAIELMPDSPEPHWNRAVALLLSGDYARGWTEFEWRRRQPWARTICFTQPRWGGEEIGGKTILLYAEQGLGDTIQFARFVPLVAARGATVILACQPELRQLLHGLPGVSRIVSTGEALPHFDLQCPLMSAPGILGIRIDSIPNRMRYLNADPQFIEKWSSRLQNHSGRIRVGLAWAGRPEHQSDRQRSIPLADLAPLAGVRSVMFYSLQKGPAAREILNAPHHLPLIDFTSELTSFAETAALIDHLDLVISVDTAVAHLAAAMGKPVWLLLPFVPDWRWMLGRSDSPWYPTMRLFRQERVGQWAHTVAHVGQSLDQCMRRGSRDFAHVRK